jgi:hypothetical protein
MEAEPEEFREMQSAAPRGLCDLLAPAETVGDNQRICRCRSHRGQQDAFGRFDEDVVVFTRFEAKGAGHVAATGN